MEWQTIAAGLFAFGWTFIFLHFAHSLRKLTDSVVELNINVARVVQKVAGHDEDITELRRRLERMEDR